MASSSTQPEAQSQLALFHHLRGNQLIKQTELESLQADEADVQTIHPTSEQLLRRDAIVSEEQAYQEGEQENANGAGDNVIIVPHVQISPNDSSQLFNRAISSGGGLLADLQRATLATHAFYAENNDVAPPRNKSPWILRRLYEWSHRAKHREMIKHVQNALYTSPADHTEGEDEQLAAFLSLSWESMFSGAERQPERSKKRLQAVWELFHSELVFLLRQLLVLRNVYKEPLKKCQVEGCLLSVEPELLFGNLDQLCRISRRFCQSFLSLVREADGTKRAPGNGMANAAELDTTEVVAQLFESFSKRPATISAYQAYCINYKATIEYLGTIRQREERFIEFERVCINDVRCGRLQLEDLLIAPLHRITRLPILLREVLKYTDELAQKARLERVLDTMNENLRSIDDSVQWLHNFERLQMLQHQVVWPPVVELEPKTYLPDFLKSALSRQFCENLIAHPRRRLVYEGPLEYLTESGKPSDCYCFLFNDMFLVTRVKRCAIRTKKSPSSSVLPPSPYPSSASKHDYYVVHRQPVPLDSCVFCDAESDISSSHPSQKQQSENTLKNAFVVIHLTRYYQVVSVYTLQTANKGEKDKWIEKFQESIESYESIQLKDMLRCTPLFSSLRRTSSGRYSDSPSPRQRSLTIPH